MHFLILTKPIPRQSKQIQIDVFSDDVLMIGTLKHLDLLVRFGGQEPGFSVPDRGSRATWADHQKNNNF